MNNDKMTALGDRLLDQTQRGELSWSETANEARFILSFPGSSVSITRGLWEHPNDSVYTLSVHNKIGTEIDSFRASPGEDAHNKLRELFEAARRSALKPDEIVDDILARLARD